MKMHFASLFLAWALTGSFDNPPPPPPPPSLRPWVDYAHALGADAGCPPNLSCVHLSRVSFSGRASSGAITMHVSGQNVGKRVAELPLLAPASEVAVVKAHFTSGKGVLRLGEATDNWIVAAQPGVFALEAELRFEPQDSLTLELPSPVAAVVDSLSDGSLIFDDTSAQHGGTLFVQSGKRQTTTKEDITMRVDRSIVYGGTTTFTYHFAVAGLREQTRMALPMLGNEAIESITPNVPYSVSSDSPSTLSVTLTSAAPIITVTGHFNTAVTQLEKPAANPLEYWLFTSDARHPVDLACDGVEIDPSEVPSLIAQPATRAFMLSATHALRISPIAVSVDKGRQGSGNAMLSYAQSGSDTWMSDLTIALQSAPGVDRMVLSSATPAHYAAVGSQAVRMFNAAANESEALSLRVSNALEPMRVQWREPVSTNDWLSWIALRLPGQTVHLDEAKGQVSLRPGFVPLSVWGVEYAHGDLFNGITLYAVLLALLGGGLARQARLPRWALAATMLLLMGLYTVDAFPHVGILVMLAGTVALVRLPDVAFLRLRDRRWAHRLLRAVWALVCLSTILQAIDYAQDRVFSALHPWAVGQAPSSDYAVGNAEPVLRPQAVPAPAAVAPATEEEDRRRPGTLSGTLKEKKLDSTLIMRARSAGGAAPKQDAAAPARSISSLREKTVLPVAFIPPDLRSTGFDYGFGALPADTEATAHLILVGPVLRGLWMIAECAALAGLLAVLLLRSKRLWFAQKEVTP